MKKMITALVAALLVSLSSWADNGFRSNHPEEYVVVEGDTLWDISSRFLEAPWLWPEVWHANPQIENPHLIFPGDVVRLIYVDGQPRLTVERPVQMTPDTGRGEDGRLRPRVRVLPADDAIPAIPLDRISSFLSRSRIVEPGVLDRVPHMLAGIEGRIIVGAGDRAYARGDIDEDVDSYGIYRKGETFVDPDTREVLGVHALDVGSGRVRGFERDVITLDIIRSDEEIRPGDRLLSSEERAVESIFVPRAPDVDVATGQIIAVERGISQVGRMDVVMINRGERDGLQVGDVMAVYKRGEVVRDRVRRGQVQLPDERAGLLMVFRTFEKMSFGIVLEAQRPLAVNDRLRNP